jgi:hypothetical protein
MSYDKLWQSDKTEWDNRQKACDVCNGSICRSPFKGYKLEIRYKNGDSRAKIYNVPCRYHEKWNPEAYKKEDEE